jgi:hypothetical protein
LYFKRYGRRADGLRFFFFLRRLKVL